jgi:hypothetical protein
MDVPNKKPRRSRTGASAAPAAVFMTGGKLGDAGAYPAGVQNHPTPRWLHCQLCLAPRVPKRGLFTWLGVAHYETKNALPQFVEGPSQGLATEEC